MFNVNLLQVDSWTCPVDFSGQDTHEFCAAKPNRYYLSLILFVIPVAFNMANQPVIPDTLSVMATMEPRSCCSMLCNAEAF